MSVEDILAKLKKFFATFFKEELTAEDNLFEVGALDSMGMVSLMTHLEEKYKVTIDPEEVTEKSFGSLRAVAEMVVQKRGSV